uniref:Uncharacterized protein n=1 Tax=Trichogramma kaykai TaxID=54128 RepID=A0ABD2W459_9HYME
MRDPRQRLLELVPAEPTAFVFADVVVYVVVAPAATPRPTLPRRGLGHVERQRLSIELRHRPLRHRPRDAILCEAHRPPDQRPSSSTDGASTNRDST